MKMEGSPAVQASLRPEQAGDEPFVHGLFAQTRAAAFTQLPLDAARLDALLRQQFQLQTTHYRQSFPGASWAIVEVDGAPIGRLYVDRSGPDMLIIDITILPEWRGLGIGTNLLRRLQDEATTNRQTIRLHVERENPARHLYRRLGFRETQDKSVYLAMQWTPGQDDRTAEPASGAVP